MPTILYFIPLFGALIGWLAAITALLFLIYPRQPINFGVCKLQGLIPKYGKQIAGELAQSLSQDFSIESWLQDKLASPNVQRDVQNLINTRLDGLVDALRNQIPMGEIFLRGAMAEKLKKQAADELMKMLPEIPQALSEHLSVNDVATNFLDKPINFSRQKQFEASIKKIIKWDLLGITLSGALLGFLIGLIEIGILSFLI